MLPSAPALPRLRVQIEGREIRTPNLLIWSQTRYRCAIPPPAQGATPELEETRRQAQRNNAASDLLRNAGQPHWGLNSGPSVGCRPATGRGAGPRASAVPKHHGCERATPASAASCGVRTHAQLPAVDLKSTPLTSRANWRWTGASGRQPRCANGRKERALVGTLLLRIGVHAPWLVCISATLRLGVSASLLLCFAASLLLCFSASLRLCFSASASLCLLRWFYVPAVASQCPYLLLYVMLLRFSAWLWQFEKTHPDIAARPRDASPRRVPETRPPPLPVSLPPSVSHPSPRPGCERACPLPAGGVLRALACLRWCGGGSAKVHAGSVRGAAVS